MLFLLTYKVLVFWTESETLKKQKKKSSGEAKKTLRRGGAASVGRSAIASK